MSKHQESEERTGQQNTLQTRRTRQEEELARHLVIFSMPNDPTPIESAISKDLVLLDHRSLRTLGVNTAERDEIRNLLLNVAVFLQGREPEAARGLLEDARAVYYQHIQSKNRLRYLGGMVVGIITTLLFTILLTSLLKTPENIFSLSLLPLILVFAGMGSITSVLTRLSSIDLRDQTSRWMVVISGMARPVTGACFAVVVYLVLALGIVEIHVGATGNPTPPSLFLVAAFMAGFSERFAQDILARFVGSSKAAEEPPEASQTDRRHIHKAQK
jgi:hypothetical protein